MAGGQQVDPAMLTAAAKFIKDVPPDQLADSLGAVKDVEVAAADFGRAHSSACEGFKAGLEQVVKCVQTYVTASENYAGSLTGAGGAYAGGETQATGDISAAGRMP